MKEGATVGRGSHYEGGGTTIVRGDKVRERSHCEK